MRVLNGIVVTFVGVLILIVFGFIFHFGGYIVETPGLEGGGSFVKIGLAGKLVGIIVIIVGLRSFKKTS
ncbi:hypothetical protein [Pseudovibrio sp. JE062]|uniref:hypothetical protein n=1 Tax=Pseudovibrio sp. JE062 TaxID=439495 RepID=UPI00056D726B|nr:hypothetical protein [Pseudovibrio sp. JE062]